MKGIFFYQYLAIIPPNPSVISDAMEMKMECKTDYGWKSAVYSLPHFTVCSFIQLARNEEKLTKCLKRIATNISPFSMHLSDFYYFYMHTCTLYIKLKNEKQFSDIVKHVNKSFKAIKNYGSSYSPKAHLTIAKGMPEPEFSKVWPNWENRKYECETKATRILLLKKRLDYPYHKYEIIGDYPFLGKGILNPQMKLF